MKLVTLALLLLANAAPAQDVEQVTVYGGNLSGFWRVEAPTSLGIHMFGKTEWGPQRPGFCRIDHDQDGYATHCFHQRGNGGTLEVDGTHFHLAWGTMLVRLVFDGEVTSATSFEGHFAAKLMGVPITNPDASRGAKIAIGPGMTDSAGKTQLLRTILAGKDVPHDPALDEAIAAARDLKLGAIETIAWLGQQRQPGPQDSKHPPDDNYLAAYAVEFTDGERVCWLHQDDDGKLAAFQCS